MVYYWVVERVLWLNSRLALKKFAFLSEMELQPQRVKSMVKDLVLERAPWREVRKLELLSAMEIQPQWAKSMVNDLVLERALWREVRKLELLSATEIQPQRVKSMVNDLVLERALWRDQLMEMPIKLLLLVRL